MAKQQLIEYKFRGIFLRFDEVLAMVDDDSPRRELHCFEAVERCAYVST